MTVAIMWFRRNLRLADNAALLDAIDRADAVVPVFAHRDVGTAHGPGVASRVWLSRSLESLGTELHAHGSQLVIRTGTPAQALVGLAEEVGAPLVTCQRDWTPEGIAEEEAVRASLAAFGVALEVSEGQLLVTPPTLITGSGGGFRVFAPYWRAWQRAWSRHEPLPAPEHVPPPARMPATAGPLSPPPGGPDVDRWWSAGEPAALRRLSKFSESLLHDYEAGRDRPDLRATSELSPRLAWGELSPRQVAAAVASAADGADPFVRQLAWREFSYHALHHFPSMPSEQIRPEFAAFPWGGDARALAAWETGRSGFPLVDAGMRQLAATGWMHNRVRLVVASFLAKDLLVRWQDGEAFFRERLVDYDVAANAFNWQWVAGSGLDAAPYFRIFNPELQGTRFDPNGDYVRRWVPELAELETRWIHRPSRAPKEVLARAGVILGKTYPEPIVDHAEARVRALAAYSAMRDARATGQR